MRLLCYAAVRRIAYHGPDGLVEGLALLFCVSEPIFGLHYSLEFVTRVGSHFCVRHPFQWPIRLEIIPALLVEGVLQISVPVKYTRIHIKVPS